MPLRTVGVRLTAEVASYMANMRQAGVVTKGLISELDKANQQRFDKVTGGAAVLGAGLLGVAGTAIKFAADFDKQMSSVQAATHASAGDMERLRAAALQAGKDTSFSATEAAQGIEELSKAGVGTADVLNGGLKGALDLAAAGSLDVGEAAETAASAMTQFGLTGRDVPHIADLLAAAAGKAQGSVHDMGYALSQSGLVANQFGLSVEDAAGTLAAFASAGLIGSDAGTSFKTMLIALANPSKKSAEMMNELGISAYDAQGQFIGITGLAGQLHDKLRALTQEQRNAALAQIFGTDAIRSANVLYEQGAAGIQAWIDKTNDAGYASETAAAMTDNLSGDIERLKGSLETLAIESASGPSSGLRLLVKGADDLVQVLSSLPPAAGETITVMALLGGAVLLGGVGWVKARRGAREFRAELEALGPAGTKAAAGMGKMTAAAGKAAAAFAVLQIANEVVHQFQDQLNPQIDALAVGLERYAKSGETAGEASRVLGDNLSDLGVGFKFLADTDNTRRKMARWGQDMLESVIPGLDGTSTSLTRTRERVTAVDEALSQMVSSGQTDQAAAAFDKLAKQFAVGGVSLDEFKKQFPQYAAALEAASADTSKTADKTNDLTGALAAGKQQQAEYKTAADAAAAATRGERDAFVDLAKKMQAETDPVFGLLDAEKKLTDAQKAAAKAVKDHGRNSAEAREKTRDLAVAAIDLQAKAGDLSSTFDGKMTPALRATLKAGGLTEKQINDVAKQFQQAKKDGDKYAKTYKADVKLDGYPGAKNKLDELFYRQQALENGTTISRERHKWRDSNIGGYSGGGWTGPGAADEPAGIVHADEFVIRKSSRRRIEATAPGLLDAMNETGLPSPPGYAGGGLVRWPYRVDASDTKIPSWEQVAAKVTPGIPTSGATAPAIVAAVRAAFPGLTAISTFREGAVTLTGNRSYHALNRAVDYPPSHELALWWNQHYFAKTKELITPWQELNIHNGQRHSYSPIVYNQHNFSGGNAHDHIAMAGGGVIAEPVVGYGLNSGRSYSFAERGPEVVLPTGSGGGGGNTTIINLTAQLAAGANIREAGRQIAAQIETYLSAGGTITIRGKQVLP